MIGINEPLGSSKEDVRDVIRAVFESSRAGSLFNWGTLISFFLLFHFNLKLKLVFVSIKRKLQHIRRLVQPRPQGFLLKNGKGVRKKPWERGYDWLLSSAVIILYNSLPLPLPLVLSFAAASITSDSVMPSNGSFFNRLWFRKEDKAWC